MSEGTRLGVNGTPSFFLDGKHVEIGATPDAFEKVIKAEIAKKSPQTSSATQQ
jgi:protein-disulfide isomerase